MEFKYPKEMSAQEVFDKIVGHLRQQGTKALNEQGCCVYFTNDGRRCAAGALVRRHEELLNIPALKGFEFRGGWHSLVDYLPEYYSDHNHLISTFQNTHDSYGVRKWEQRFQEIASDHSLVYTPPE